MVAKPTTIESAKYALRQVCEARGVRPESLTSKVSDAVTRAREENLILRRPGTVTCGQVYRGQRAEDIPYKDGSIAVFASKGRSQIGTALSPFTVDVPKEMVHCWATVDGEPQSQALPLLQKLELVWQAAKMAAGESWEDYFARRARIYKAQTPKRRYMDRDAKIAGACFGCRADGLIEYVTSRAFYCTAYECAVKDLPEYLLLKDLVEDGFNILLLGPDGYPLDVDAEAVESAYLHEGSPFGHERVIVALLRGLRPWTVADRFWQK